MNEAVPSTHIYMPTSLRIEVEQAFSLQRHYFEPYLNGHTISQLKCYAITLTVPDSTVKFIREREANLIDFFYFLLKKHNMLGIYVLEYTKKGVEHIHGIVYSKDIEKMTKKVVRNKGGNTYTYLHPTYPYEHTIKEVKTNQAFTGWKNYIVKGLIHPNVVEFFNIC